MKTIKIIIILLLIANGLMYSQSNEPIVSRYSLQIRFINKYFANKKPEIKDTSQLNSVFKDIDNAWKAFVKDSLSSKVTGNSVEALNNVDAYSYFLVLFSFNNDAAKNKELISHLLKKYMLPSFNSDIQFIRNNRTLTNLKLIWAGSLANMSLGNTYIINTADFNVFYTFVVNLKALLSLYNDSDNETKAYKTTLWNIIESFSFETETRHYYLNNQPDISFTYFITGLSTNKIHKPNAILFGKTLIDYFSLSGNKDKSIAILNNLFVFTTTDELPRDTLQKWYIQVDSLNGKKFYTEMSKKFVTDYFQVSENLSIKFPAKWDLITDSTFQQKIQKASYILIDFWYTGCPPCLSEVPKLNTLYSFMKDRDDVVFISINADYFKTKEERSYVNSVAKRLNIQFPIVYDNEKNKFVNQFHVNDYPAKFIVDKQGRMITKNDKSPITLETFYDFLKIKNNR